MTGSVFIVDDSPSDVELLVAALQRQKIYQKIHVAHSAKEAIAWLTDVSALPTLILLDVNLPDLSGFEVLGFLRAEPRFKDVAIIVITAYGHPGEEAKAHALGANGYFIKPVIPSEFQQTIQEITETWLSA